MNPPKIGDMVILTTPQPAYPTQAESVREAWQRRRDVPSLVIATAGDMLTLITPGDKAHETWFAKLEDIRITGVAIWSSP